VFENWMLLVSYYFEMAINRIFEKEAISAKSTLLKTKLFNPVIRIKKEFLIISVLNGVYLISA